LEAAPTLNFALPDSPATDFANLARSFGLYGEGPIRDPDEIHAALERGLKVVND